MTKKLALFPMTRDMCAVARYPSLLRGYELSCLFVSGYMDLSGADISVLDGGSPAGAVLTNYAKDKLAGCQALFVDYDENIKNTKIYEEVVTHAAELGIEVIRSRKLARILDKQVPAWSDGIPLQEHPEFDSLYNIRAPIITVLSHGARADQLAVELALRKHFIDEGYRVAQIGSCEASLLFDFPHMPDFLYEPCDTYEKIIRFNRYVHDLAKQKKPDIFIIGAPGGVMKYNNKYLNGMGLLPFTVCSAVTSDVIILSAYHEMYKKTFFDELVKYGQYRFGTPIQFFNVANTGFIPEFDDEIVKTKYVNLTSEFVLNNMKDIQADEYLLFNVLEVESAAGACKAITDNLTANVGYIV